MLLRRGSAQASEGSAGEDAWTGSGSRVTDTSPKTVWAPWVVEGCVKRVWQHEMRMRKKTRREFWMLEIREESPQ